MKLSQRVLIAVLNWLTAKLNVVMSVGLNADESSIEYRQASGMIISDEPGTCKMRHGGQRKMRFKGICRLVEQREYVTTIDFMATHFWIIVFYCCKSLWYINKPPVALKQRAV